MPDLADTVSLGSDVDAEARPDAMALSLLRNAIAHVRDGIGLYDRTDCLIACNDAYAAIFGSNPAAMVGSTAADNYRCLLNQCVSQVGAREAAPPDAADSIVARLTAVDGEPIDVRDHEGHWTQITGRKTDAGGRTYIHTYLRGSRSTRVGTTNLAGPYQDIFDACPVPITVADDASDGIVYANAAYRRLFEADRTGSKLESALDAIADIGDRRALRAHLDATGRVENLEVELKLADGALLWAAVSAQRVEISASPVVVSTIVDLTDRKAAERETWLRQEAIYQSEKHRALGALLANMAHELSNPLSVVVGHAHLLAEAALDRATAERVAKIEQAASRCSRTVKAFLGMAGQHQSRIEAVDLNELVESTLEIAEPTLRGVSVTVERCFAPTLPPMYADPYLLGQVVTNLVANAKQAVADRPEPRRVRIATHFNASADEFVLVVADNGPGMSDDVRRRIFEPYFTTKQAGEGAGIGLARCHKIVEALGGRIDAHSEPGDGATFVVTLPDGVNDGSRRADDPAPTTISHGI